MNTVRVSGNLESATVEGKHFAADVEKDYCIVNLEHYTFKFDRQQFDNMETLIELCRGIWEVD